jgi:hypothetical protein
MQKCEVAGCDRAVLVKSRSWCAKHYHRWWRTGDPLKAAYERRDGTPQQRWLASTDRSQPNGCWLWTGSKPCPL